MEYFIERVVEIYKFNNPTIRPDEEFLLSTIENVTVAKGVYTMIFNTIARNFNLAISNLSYCKKKDIGDDFLSKNFSYEDSLTNLDAWISFYYLYGRFPGSEEFVNVPFVSKPVFSKTENNLSPVDLYSKFSATDAKGVTFSSWFSCFEYLFWRKQRNFENCIRRIYEKFNLPGFKSRKRQYIFIF